MGGDTDGEKKNWDYPPFLLVCIVNQTVPRLKIAQEVVM